MIMFASFCFSLVIWDSLNNLLANLSDSTYNLQPSTLYSSSGVFHEQRDDSPPPQVIQKVAVCVATHRQTPFTGGIISGGGTASGTTIGAGSVEAEVVNNVLNDSSSSDSTGLGTFIINNGSSGFVDTVYGSAEGSGAGGATGSQVGTVGIRLGSSKTGGRKTSPF
jgi:hypothetical protein